MSWRLSRGVSRTAASGSHGGVSVPQSPAVWIAVSAAVLIVALAAPAYAEEATPGYRFALAGAISAHGLDLATSMHAIGAGQASEINPVLAPFSDKPLAFAAVKMGLASVGLLATDALRRNGHPKWAMALALIQTAVFTYVAIRNERLVRR